MSERHKYDRIVFPHAGDQTAFLVNAKNTLDATWDDLASLIGLHPRTIRDWVREKYCMPLSAAKILARKATLKLPQGAKVKIWKEHLSYAGLIGGRALVKKNGGYVVMDEDHRQKKWRDWWEKTGKYGLHPILNKPLTIRKPSRTERLAEFVGIVLGDGGIARFQVVITLHRTDDEQYSHFVRRLISDLFQVILGTYRQRNAWADNIVISRVELVRFCVEKLGLKVGNKVKQQVDIPGWIKKNRNYLTACLRGLIDTDGCVFTHRYTVKNKIYNYKKLSFTTASQPLRQSVYEALENLGMKPRLADSYDVRLDRIADIKKYFDVVGSHNPKHLKRYLQ